MSYYESKYSGEELDEAIGKVIDGDMDYVPTSRKVNGKPLNTDIALTAADVGASNRNMFDNWDFRNPVNQRNVSSWSAGYGLDRWVAQPTTNINVAVMDGYVSVTGELNDGIFTLLPLKSLIAGETYTISILLLDGTVKSASVVAPQDISDFNGANIYSEWVCGIRRNGNNTWSIYSAVTYAGTPQTINIQATKLELGSVSTLANDPPADYGEELRKCQRYYQVYRSGESGLMIADMRNPSLSSAIQGVFGLIAPMRITPSLASYAGTPTWYNATGGSVVATGVGIHTGYSDNQRIDITFSRTYEASQGIYGTGFLVGADAYIAFSAEL